MDCHKRRRLENKKKYTGIKDILQGEDVKFIKSFRLRLYGYVERMQKQRLPKEFATARNKEKREVKMKRRY